MAKKEKAPKQKKPIYKKWWFWVIIVFVVIGIFAPKNENKDNTNKTEVAETTESVKETETTEAAKEIETTEETETKETETVETEEVTEAVDTEKHIYDNAQVKPVMNGVRTEKIGEYSIIRIASEEATEEALADWYFNYVSQNNFNWCMILYTDKENIGVYANNGLVEKDLPFEEDEYGDYSVGSSDNSTLYVPTEEGTLKEMIFDDSEE